VYFTGPIYEGRGEGPNITKAEDFVGKNFKKNSRKFVMIDNVN
jgi:hypothetical protein